MLDESLVSLTDDRVLSGDTRAHKKSVYEPSGSQRCRQIICSRNKAMAATITIGIVIIAIALFAAFARPVLHPSCPISSYQNNQSTTDSPTQPKTEKILDTNGKIFPWQDIRLPEDVIPESYHIFMHPNISESWFKGRIEMTLRIIKPTDFIIFHVKDLNITSYTVKHSNHGNSDNNNPEIKIRESMEAKQLQQYYLLLDSTLTKDQRVMLAVEFRGDLISKLAGFYKSTYQTKTNQSRSIATTHFEPTDARAAFPCLDEPELKANFTLHMVRDSHHVGLFNMPLVETVKFKGNELLKEDHFQTSVKMSTYLVAFVVSDFSNLTSYTQSGVMVRVFAPTELIHTARFALDSAVKILDYYDSFFGIKYPLPKQDLIAVPDFAAGAMENWGLITYRMTSILYDPNESSDSNKQWVATVVAHELAHQWFGNLVTMKWWNDLWLNEGFAAFVEYIGANLINPDWKVFDQFVSNDLLHAMNLDSLSNSHPIQVTVDNPAQINEIFDSISYDKGSSILRMLQNFLGMENFKKGLHNYLLKYSYSNTVTTDLWRSLTEASVDKGLDVTQIMNTWTKQMGYPVITLKQNGNQIEATQTHFLLHPAQNTQLESPYGYKWCVPLSYVTSVKPQSSQIVWMNMSSASFELPAGTEWLKANYEMYGYYRVNYDDNMWNKLIELMKTNHSLFSAGDRAGLIDDAFALSRAGLMVQTTALDLSTYLVKEKDYVPWNAAMGNIHYIKNRLLDSPAYDDFKVFFLNLLSPIVDTLGWEDVGSHLDRYLRKSVLSDAVNLGHKPSIDAAKKRFYQWMNEGKSLPVNLRSVIYSAGVRYGGAEEWRFCLNRYLTTDIATEKRLMLHALAATTEINLLTRYLQYSLDMTKVRSQDCANVISAVARNPYGRLLAWRFVRQNWLAIQERLGNGLFSESGLIKSISSSFSTHFDYAEVKVFFTANPVDSAERAVKQALETIEMNIEWLNKNEASVSNWLEANKNFNNQS